MNNKNIAGKVSKLKEIIIEIVNTLYYTKVNILRIRYNACNMYLLGKLCLK